MQVTEEHTAKIIACRLKGHIISTKWPFKWLKPRTKENQLTDEAVKACYQYCWTCTVAKLSTESTGPE